MFLTFVHVFKFVSCVLLLVLSCVVCDCCLAVCIVVVVLYMCCYLMCICCTFFNLDAGLLARSQYSEGPAIGNHDTGFSWFPCV